MKAALAARLGRYAAFGAVGATGFAVDAALLEILIRLADWNALAARVPAIAVAGLATYLLNRRFTFKAAGHANLAEAVRYAAGLASASALNYGMFAGLLIAFPALAPFLALVAASLAAMALSYAWHSRIVFAKPA